MMRSRTIIISLTSITSLGIGILYYNHLNLLSLYPTLSIPKQVLISNRNNGDGRPTTTAQWAKCELGDSWAVKIPKDQLLRNLHPPPSSTIPGTGSTAEDGDVGVKWNQAFWSSWMLRLEGRLFNIANKIIGIKSIESDEAKEVDLEGGGFRRGGTLLNGLFTIESIDQIPLNTPQQEQGMTASSITYKWGNLKPSINSKIIINGGYHTLSILPSSSFGGNTKTSPSISPGDNQRGKKEEEEEMYLIFSCEGVLPPSYISTSGTTNLENGLNLLDRLFIGFHREYARSLIHLAVKNMGLLGKVDKVTHWPNEMTK